MLDGRQADPSHVGGKGASLDRLIRTGVPVPPAGVVTTAIYRRVVQQPGPSRAIERLLDGADLSAEQVDGAFGGAVLDPDDAACIAEVARAVGGGHGLAIRSSATVEDGDRSSFAGQYRTLLDVDPHDPARLEEAVKAVFASLWHPAPRAYRRALGIPEELLAMAVVLMRMVPATRAGVVFTVDPSGATDAARIEAVAGLADSLVSGAETPEAVVLPRCGPRSSADPVLVEALDRALQIEESEGFPQDVEWVWDGERVWVVQARPITTAGDEWGDGFDDGPHDVAGLDLTTAGIGEMLPGVLPPLVWSLAGHVVEDAFRRLLDGLGALPDDVIEPTSIVRRVRGRAAMDFGALRQMAASLPGAAAEHLEDEYFGSRRRGRPAAPVSTARVGRLRSATHDLRVLRIRQVSVTEATTMIHAVDAVLAGLPDPADLEPPGLLALHARLVDLAGRTMAAELGVAADAAATYRRLQALLVPHLGEEGAGREAERLVTGIGVSATIPASASAAVFAGPTWLELGRSPPVPGQVGDPGKVERLGTDELLDRLRTTPGWREDSVRILFRRRAIRRLVHETSHRLQLREQTKAALLRLGGAVRRLHLDAGGRLTASGLLARSEDVDLLSPAELRASVAERWSVPPDTLAHRDRFLGQCRQEGALPVRFSGWPRPVEVSELDGDRVEGWAASGGRCRGRVTVVHSPTADLEPGSVLVAEATDPSWSPLFIRAGAIVLDRGGPLSHAAILARELGVPAVLNVPGATARLDGHEVTVDGDAGVVIVHDEPEVVAS